MGLGVLSTILINTALLFMLHTSSTVEKKLQGGRLYNALPIISLDVKTENAFFGLQSNSSIKHSAFNKLTTDHLTAQKTLILHDKKKSETVENLESVKRFAKADYVKSEQIELMGNSRANYKTTVNKPFKINEKKRGMEFFGTSEKKEYRLYVYLGLYELGKSPIGTGTLKYLFDSKNRRYNIELRAEATGWTKLFVQKPIVYESRGFFNFTGLSSEYYALDGSRKGKENAKVDYEKQTIYFSSTKKTESFSGKVFDPLSLIFNTFVEANKGVIFDNSNDLLFSVFNRQKIELIKLQPSTPEEMILPNGDSILATKVVCQSENESEKKKGGISFWLDNSHGFHPVRITFQNKKKQRTLDFLISTSN